MLTKQEKDTLVLKHVKDAQGFALGFLKQFGVRIPRTDLDDLRAEANLSLVKAANSFNPAYPHTTFRAYLHGIIHYAVLDWCNSRTIIHFPAGIRRNQEGRLTKSAHLMRLMAKAKAYSNVSDNIPDTSREHEQVQELLSEMMHAVSQLGNDDRMLVERYFGVNGHQRATLQTLATEEAMSREAIRRRIRRAIHKLCRRLDLPEPNNRKGAMFTFSPEKVAKIFARLTPRQQDVAGAFYGIDRPAETIEQIANRKGVILSEVTVGLQDAHRRIGRLLTHEALVDAVV